MSVLTRFIVAFATSGLLLAYLVNWYPTTKTVHPAWKNFGKRPDDISNSSVKATHRYQITFSPVDVEDFQSRLLQSRIPPEMDPGVNMTYGYPSSNLRNLRDILIQLDWTEWANRLNRYEQYKLNLWGIDIHFVWIKGPRKEGLPVVPLLLIHGWPGSFYEFYEAVPYLLSYAESNGFTYDIVIPSIPGYGFSEACYRTGCGPKYVAAIFNDLMSHLGYNKYISQGGDWGAIITEWIAALYPDHLIGWHVNLFFPQAGLRHILALAGVHLFPGYFLSPIEEDIISKKGVLSVFKLILLEGGYFHLQSTKPDTVGAALTDSPLGLAAYILEKFYTWTNEETLNKSVEEATQLLPFNIKDVLYNILIYWHSNSITSSVRLYKEVDMTEKPYLHKVNVPSGVLNTYYEIVFSPEYIVKNKYANLVRYTALPKGGHFAAFELPDIFSYEVVQFTKAALEVHTD